MISSGRGLFDRASHSNSEEMLLFLNQNVTNGKEGSVCLFARLDESIKIGGGAFCIRNRKCNEMCTDSQFVNKKRGFIDTIFRSTLEHTFEDNYYQKQR